MMFCDMSSPFQSHQQDCNPDKFLNFGSYKDETCYESNAPVIYREEEKTPQYWAKAIGQSPSSGSDSTCESNLHYDLSNLNFGSPSSEVYSNMDEQFGSQIDSDCRMYHSTSSSGMNSLYSPSALSPSHSTMDSPYNPESYISSDSEDDYKRAAKQRTRKVKNSDAYSPSDKNSKKQNKMKNFPGLIFQNMKTQATAGNQEYLKMIDLRNNEFVTLKTFLDGYNKQWKTWASIAKFVQKTPQEGKKALDMVLCFLNNHTLFEQWVLNGRMDESNKQLIRDRKGFFVTKFDELYASLKGVDLSQSSKKKVKAC